MLNSVCRFVLGKKVVNPVVILRLMKQYAVVPFFSPQECGYSTKTGPV